MSYAVPALPSTPDILMSSLGLEDDYAPSKSVYNADSDSGWSSDSESESEDTLSLNNDHVKDTGAAKKHEEDSTPTQASPKEPEWSFYERESLPIGVKLLNFLIEDAGLTLRRDEPANKEYPSLRIPPSFKKYDAVYITVQVFNSATQVYMRVPNPKTKPLQYKRSENQHGMFVKPKDTDIISFKKKCTDKTSGKDVAFELGKKFLSFTEKGETPQFVFVITPCSKTGYIKDKSVRSETFRVFSKRQERYLNHKNKRKRKHTEIAKRDTDIRDAKLTLSSLKEQALHFQFANEAMERFKSEMRSMAEHLENDTAKLAILFALRDSEGSEIATL